MANEEQVEKLKEGAESWNEWRKQNHDVALDFSLANLEGANLSDANLEGAVFSRANLEGANLSDANLEGAVFYRTNLEGANLSGANLKRAQLNIVNLKGADLERAYLEGADLYRADLKGANLIRANLKGAILERAYLEGADLYNANLEGADLRSVKNIRLDGTRTKDTQFFSQAADPWSKLRRTYTGPKLTFLLLGLIAFVLPYIGKIGFWSFVNRGQGYTQGLLETIKQRAHAQGIDDQTITALGLSQEKITSLSQCLSAVCEQRSVGQLLLGMDKGGLFWVLPVVLVTYNVLRGALTYFIASMRDEEERSGYSPIWVGRRNTTDLKLQYMKFRQNHGAAFYSNSNQVRNPKLQHKEWWQGYRVFFYLHQVVVLLAFVAFVAFVINAYHWLFQPIYLPI